MPCKGTDGAGENLAFPRLWKAMSLSILSIFVQNISDERPQLLPRIPRADTTSQSRAVLLPPPLYRLQNGESGSCQFIHVKYIGLWARYDIRIADPLAVPCKQDVSIVQYVHCGAGVVGSVANVHDAVRPPSRLDPAQYIDQYLRLTEIGRAALASMTSVLRGLMDHAESSFAIIISTILLLWSDFLLPTPIIRLYAVGKISFHPVPFEKRSDEDVVPVRYDGLAAAMRINARRENVPQRFPNVDQIRHSFGSTANILPRISALFDRHARVDEGRNAIVPPRRTVGSDQVTEASIRRVVPEEGGWDVLVRIAVDDGPIEVPYEEGVDGG
mmetsp:Transcript_27611/g.66486  ORF Transcript_27611/g.66486 Transcript_27611/m.66486 type:complete len:329 (-) Transcript_27611:95-1081(-)